MTHTIKIMIISLISATLFTGIHAEKKLTRIENNGKNYVLLSAKTKDGALTATVSKHQTLDMQEGKKIALDEKSSLTLSVQKELTGASALWENLKGTNEKAKGEISVVNGQVTLKKINGKVTESALAKNVNSFHVTITDDSTITIAAD